MLNKLLNEMDGLKEDADILFVLTTNRPEDLEGALAGRPGRVDQAIEDPLSPMRPVEASSSGSIARDCRWKSRSSLEAARRSEGTSCAVHQGIDAAPGAGGVLRAMAANPVTSADIDEALDDMLFSGGRLNAQLLGGAQAMATG